MGVVRARESGYEQEMAKWNKPYVHQEYPRMLYRARVSDNGQPKVIDPANDAWSMGNCLTVLEESAFLRAKADGWCETVPEALKAFEKAGDDLSRAAAERAYADSRMSEKAQREAAAAQAEAPHRHLPGVEEKPVRRRGRPKKKTAN